MIKAVTKKLKQTLVDNINHQCQLCHCDTSLSQQWVCTTCEVELPFSPAACITCAAPLKSNTLKQCGQCLINPPAIDRLITCFDYLYPINKWVPAFKFSQQTALASWLAKHLADSIITDSRLTNSVSANAQAEFLPEAIIAVPLHGKRLKQRGYNQSELIAKHLSRLFDIPLLTGAVIRTKVTEAQSGLSLKQRQSNIRQAFKVTQELPDHMAIVDDVFTTGSTLNELSRQLKLAGCQRTQGWVIAHAPLN